VLQKIIGIRNVGRLRNSTGAPNPAFLRHTLIFAPNGSGKSTLTTVLRSLAEGRGELVTGRRWIAGDAPPDVQLLVSGRPRRFTDGAWDDPEPLISVFDESFVAENVHAGQVVAVDQRRGLYRVIVGRAGVGLAEREKQLAGQARGLQGEITRLEAALAAHHGRMPLAIFKTLAADEGVAAKIETQTRVVEAAKQAEAIRTRQPLSLLPVPDLLAGLEALLSATLEGVGADVEAIVAQHLAAHQMHDGQAWVARGVEYATGDDCAFCGRPGAEGLALVQAYRALFSDAYRRLREEVREGKARLAQSFGAIARGQLATQEAANRAALEFWARYGPVLAIAFPELERARADLERLNDDLVALFDRKLAALLEPLDAEPVLQLARARLAGAAATLQGYNQAVATANEAIAEIKQRTDAANVAEAEAQLQRLRLVEVRQRPDVDGLCGEHTRLEREKRGANAEKAQVRTALEAHCRTVIRPYETRINELLELFNTGFRIDGTGHGYPGGIATSSYGLVIEGRPVPLGDANSPLDEPSFRNTLSAGDRSTLALAFFIAQLEREPDLGQRIVIFDDPFASQDAGRRLNTKFEILGIAERAGQVIVLSHEASFLKDVWDRCPHDSRAALQLQFHEASGSKLIAVDLDAVCTGRAASELNDLLAFRGSGVGNPRDIIKKLRIVLEDYHRSSFPGCFAPLDNLGDIIRKTREGGADHPVAPGLPMLTRINDYTAQHHHGEDARGRPEPPINADELMGFVRQSLRLAGYP
jgi:wobble nucleotide-excising tRNase